MLLVLSGGPQHIYLAFEKKAFWDVLVKIHEVMKGKVNCKRLFCFDYVQVSGNMELLIKVFGELKITAAVKLLLGQNREPRYPRLASGLSFRPAGRLSACCQDESCPGSTTQPWGKRLFLELCFRPLLLGSREGSVHL